MITTAALIVVGFAMYKYGQSSEEIRRREGEKELLAQVLSSNEKWALAQNVTDDIIRKMDTIYGINWFLGQKISDLQLELLRGYIQGMLLEGDDLSKLCDPTKKSASRIAFIHDTIMDSKNLFFIKNSLWLNVTPYENLQDYIDQFTYILSFPWEIELQYCDGVSAESSMIVDTDKTKYQIEYEKFIDDLKSRSYPRPLPEHLFNARMLNMYGKDYMDSKGDHYALLRVRGSDGKEFILAHKKNGPFLATQMNSYTKSEGERVAKDFLEKRASKEGK